MANLKKYTSFEAMKSTEKTASKDGKSNYSEFESFIKRLQKEHSNKEYKVTEEKLSGKNI